MPPLSFLLLSPCGAYADGETRKGERGRDVRRAGNPDALSGLKIEIVNRPKKALEAFLSAPGMVPSA